MNGFWLSPPALAMAPSVSWLLGAAFAAASPTAPPEGDEKVLTLARDLEISGRIAERLRRTDRLGLSNVETEFDADYQTNLAVDAQLGHALKQVSTIAAQQAIPVIALKYAALRQTGVVRPGTRVAGDLDLLVPEGAIARLWRALIDFGFVRAGTRAHAHQLEALVGPFGAVVELHRHLPGVCLVPPRVVTADQLFAASLVEPIHDLAVWSPKPAVLAAHALAHGLLQNRATPQSYSLLRMLCDLVDLRAAHEVSPILDSARYCAPALLGASATAERLCSALTRAAVNGPEFEGTAEQRLLWHCLAARLDPDYAQRLRFSGFSSALRGGSAVFERFRYVVGALHPTEHELDAIYGPARSIPMRVRRRLLRPFDLGLRLWRYWSRSRSR